MYDVIRYTWVVICLLGIIFLVVNVVMITRGRLSPLVWYIFCPWNKCTSIIECYSPPLLLSAGVRDHFGRIHWKVAVKIVTHFEIARLIDGHTYSNNIAKKCICFPADKAIRGEGREKIVEPSIITSSSAVVTCVYIRMYMYVLAYMYI